jgi:hypothetical protein
LICLGGNRKKEDDLMRQPTANRAVGARLLGLLGGSIRKLEKRQISRRRDELAGVERLEGYGMGPLNQRNYLQEEALLCTV